MNTSFIFGIITIILVIILILAFRGLNGRQHKLNKEFDDSIKDSVNCPKTTMYLARWQAIASTWPYGGIGGSLIGGLTFILLLVLYFNKQGHDTPLRPGTICIIVLFVTITAMFIVYKLINCVSARICGFDFCGKELT